MEDIETTMRIAEHVLHLDKHDLEDEGVLSIEQENVLLVVTLFNLLCATRKLVHDIREEIQHVDK